MNSFQLFIKKLEKFQNKIFQYPGGSSQNFSKHQPKCHPKGLCKNNNKREIYAHVSIYRSFPPFLFSFLLLYLFIIFPLIHIRVRHRHTTITIPQLLRTVHFRRNKKLQKQKKHETLKIAPLN